MAPLISARCTDVCSSLLAQLGVHPVLVDVGASGGTPEIWGGIARHSVYVGFDPDSRDTHEIPGSKFYKATMVNEAITSEPGSESVTFYLTNSPFCSSTLNPDRDSLEHFLHADEFVVEGEAKVRCTTLDKVVERLGLTDLDWLKLDSQGTDLRIYRSLNADLRRRVIAVDIEPGLIDAYIGEDLFAEAHRALTQEGFWLSRLNVCGAVRMKATSLQEVMSRNRSVSRDLVADTVRISPGWCEARYLRTTERLAGDGLTRRRWVLLWVFALLDGQVGFALDVAVEYRQLFGDDEVSRVLFSEPLRLMRQASRTRLDVAGRRVLRILRRVKRRLFNKPHPPVPQITG